jgi:hypothetical protein
MGGFSKGKYDLGQRDISGAWQLFFQVTVIGRNSSSSGYTVCVDYFKLTPQ